MIKINSGDCGMWLLIRREVGIIACLMSTIRTCWHHGMADIFSDLSERVVAYPFSMKCVAEKLPVSE